MDYIKQQGYKIENIENIIECKNSIVFDIDNKNKLLLINSNVLKLKEETIKDLFNILTKKRGGVMEIGDVIHWAVEMKSFRKDRDGAFYNDYKKNCKIIITDDSCLIINNSVFEIDPKNIYFIIKNLIEDKND